MVHVPGGRADVRLLVDVQLFLQVFAAPDVFPVVLLDVVGAGVVTPILVQLVRGLGHAILVPAAVSDEDHVGEALAPEAVRDILQHHAEGLLAHAQGPRIADVLGVSFRHVLHDGRAERIAEFARDRVAHRFQHVVVLAARHVGTVLLYPAGRDDADGLPGGDLVTRLHPGQLVDPDGVDAFDGPRGRPHLLLAPLALCLLLRSQVPATLGFGRRDREQGEHQHSEYPLCHLHLICSR